MTGPAGLGEGTPDPEQTPESASLQQGSTVEEPKTAQQDAEEQTESQASDTPREVLEQAREQDESGA